MSSSEEIITIKDCKEIASIQYDDHKFIKSYSIVQLEMTENSVVGNIAQLQLFEDRIYILDRQSESLFVFNIDGSFSHKIGVIGRGPQELLAMNAFYINPERKEIAIFDPLTYRAQVFDLVGKFVATKNIQKEVLPQNFSNVRYLGNNRLVCYADPNYMSENVLMILREEDMSIEDVLTTSPIEVDDGSYKMAVQPYSLVDGKLHFVNWFDGNIYEYKDGKVIPLIEVDGGKPLISEGALQAAAENNNGSYLRTVIELLREGKYFLGIQNLYETSRFIFCDIKYDSYSGSLLVWDKVNNNGIFARKQSLSIPGIKEILYSSGNKLVSHWTEGYINSYKVRMGNGEIDKNTIDSKIADVLDAYNPLEDNPILFIYEMND